MIQANINPFSANDLQTQYHSSDPNIRAIPAPPNAAPSTARVAPREVLMKTSFSDLNLSELYNRQNVNQNATVPPALASVNHQAHLLPHTNPFGSAPIPTMNAFQPQPFQPAAAFSWSNSTGSMQEPSSFADESTPISPSNSFFRPNDLEILKANSALVEGIITNSRDDLGFEPISDTSDEPSEANSPQVETAPEPISSRDEVDQSSETGSAEDKVEESHQPPKKGLLSFWFWSTNVSKKTETDKLDPGATPKGSVKTDQQPVAAEAPPEKDRFGGEGLVFKAKIIGELPVAESKGDQVCQKAIHELKMSVKASGLHKRRIFISVAESGIRMTDEKTKELIHHHPIEKISFVIQDHTDYRAFGYIFGLNETGFMFHAIKTEKAASPVIVAMSEVFHILFQRYQKQALGQTEAANPPPAAPSEEPSASPQAPQRPQQLADEATKTPGNTLLDLFDAKQQQYQQPPQQQQQQQSEPDGSVTKAPFMVDKKSHGDLDELSMLDQLGKMSMSPMINPAMTSQPFHVPGPASAAPMMMMNAGKMVSQPLVIPQKSHMDNFPVPVPRTSAFPDLVSSNQGTPISSPWGDLGQMTATSPPSREQVTRVDSKLDMFMDLDPLGTGKSRPYVDPKDFFSDLRSSSSPKLSQLLTPPQIPANTGLKDNSANTLLDF